MIMVLMMNMMEIENLEYHQGLSQESGCRTVIKNSFKGFLTGCSAEIKEAGKIPAIKPTHRDMPIKPGSKNKLVKIIRFPTAFLKGN